MFRRTLLSVGLVATVGLAACSDDVTGPGDEPAFALDTAAVEDELKPGPMTVAEKAGAEGFSLLLAAVEYIAGTNEGSPLVAGLLDKSQVTVFAPSNTAFENLVNAVADQLDPEILEQEGPFAAIDDLLGPGTIEAVVSYHVTEGRRSSKSVLPKNGEREIETLLEGATFEVTSMGMIEAVGSTATIELPDVSASNGVIHAIDTVLLPVDLGL